MSASICWRISSVQGSPPKWANLSGRLRGSMPSLAGRLGDGEGVAGRAYQHLGAQILDDLDLAPGVAGGGGHHRRADLLDAVVQSEAAREQAVAEGHVHGVLGLQAAGGEEAGAQVGPELQVVRRIGHEGGLAGGAGGAVDAGELLAGHGDEAQGMVTPQVVLGGEGQPAQIVQAFAWTWA
jgi:hypothetical protein